MLFFQKQIVLINAGVGIKVTLKPEYRLTPSVCELNQSAI